MAAKQYSPEDLENAISEVQDNGASIRAIAEKYLIPKSTLHDHLKGKSKTAGAGGPTVLSPDVEREISLACITLADMGYGLTRDLVEVVVFEYLKDQEIPNPFVGGVPGRDWWHRFMLRWPRLSERRPQNLSKSRARASNPEIMNAWFNKLDEVFANLAFDPRDPTMVKHRLWNCDETAFCTSPVATKLLARRGSRVVHEIGGDSGHQYVTVHCCGSASGERLPPFILYKGKNMYQRWIEGGPAGTLYGITESGWMDGANYLSWFTKLFLPAVSHLTKTAPVVLIQDGHHSHISLELIQQARDNNVVLLCLPPNTTHLLQPLDVGVFAPVKKAWKKILKEYKLQTRGLKASKEVFPSLIGKLWDAALKPSDFIGGFRGVGLVPYSREHVMKKLPSSATAATSDSTCSPRQRTRSVACTTCGHEMPATPILQTKILSYFAGILEIKSDAPQIGQRNNLRIRVEGEAITSDEFQTLLEEDMARKERKKEEKKSRAKRGKKTGRSYSYRCS